MRSAYPFAERGALVVRDSFLPLRFLFQLFSDSLHLMQELASQSLAQVFPPGLIFVFWKQIATIKGKRGLSLCPARRAVQQIWNAIAST